MAGTSGERQREVMEGAIEHRRVKKADIVIKVVNFMDRHPMIYVQDYSIVTAELLPNGVGAFINSKHVRVFEDMRMFTKWLLENGVVVDCCWVIP